MSKYIKLEDAIHNINLEVTGRKEYTCDMKANLFFALDDLPTIEVSEDCISREYILGEAFMSGEYNGETKSFDLPVVSVRDIEDAPSVVPQVPSEDCISREEVLSIISDCQDIEDKAKYNTLAEVFNRVLDAPSVTTEQSSEVGEWIKYYEYCEELDRELWYGYTCSLCGRWEGNAEPYCNCGAKMKG